MSELTTPPSVDRPLVPDLWAVVPAGGAGTRLWPLSRAGAPKFLHDLTGSGRSLLQGTVDRLGPLVGERVLVVTGRAHRSAVLAQLPQVPAARVIAEPSARDSMAAIGLAAALVERAHPDALVGSFAADHVIGDEQAFHACVAEAAALARTGLLVTIGIEPTHAATGFGYIRAGARLPELPTARAVQEFVEKPDAARAGRYVASGEFWWNAGMFVVGATRLLDLLAEHHPDLAAGLRLVAAEPHRLEEVWDGLEKIAIDHAVAEPAAAAGRVGVVPGGFGWDDVGDWASLAALVERRSDDVVLGDPALVLGDGRPALVVPGTGRTVAVLGLDDVVVVDTGDVVLVTSRERAQDVRGLVEALREAGRTDLL